MKAMILAAGLGTRLRPLTNDRPKALLPVGNRPLIDRNISYLLSYGVTEVVVNAHHLANQIQKHVEKRPKFEVPVHVLVEPEILGTAGGIRNASDFWDDEPFLVLNGDVLTDIDLGAAYAAHRASGALATLILHSREPFNQILVNSRLDLLDIADNNLPNRVAFTGIHIIEPRLLEYVPKGGCSQIIPCYRTLMAAGHRIRGYMVQGNEWHDIGTPSSYLEANRAVSRNAPFLLGAGSDDGRSHVALKDWAVVGESCRIDQTARIVRSVLWDHVIVHRGAKVVDSIVTSHREVRGDVIGGII